jgi:hypothetical protein
MGPTWLAVLASLAAIRPPLADPRTRLDMAL